jgi:5'-3' exonuclease
VTIVSTDKDFYQIVDNRIKIYSPTKKKVYGPDEILSEFNINSKNYVLYRVLDGDVSDNINGIKGCGLKTIVKAFPFLGDDKKYTIDDLYVHAEQNKGKYKVYDYILENKITISRNYDLMQLSDTIMSTNAQLNVSDILKKKNKLNKFEFIKMVTEDKMWNALPGYGVWIESTFRNLDSYII